MKPEWIHDVVELLDSGQTHPTRVFTLEQLNEILDKQRERLRLPASLTRTRFVEALQNTGKLRQLEIKPSHGKKADRNFPSYKSFIRYIWKQATSAEIALSLRSRSYLSHGTAALLNALSDTSDAVYANKEQAPKPQSDTTLSQEGIDKAFSNPARVSKYVYEFEGERLVLLNGKYTSDFEVIQREEASGYSIRYTSLERTLFDISVRPAYAGGVPKVLEAYRRARERFSVPKMIKVIKELDHIYPYHQAVGFYLGRVGFAEQDLSGFKRLGLDFNFYLANRMKPAEFDSEWRIFFPANLPRY